MIPYVAKLQDITMNNKVNPGDWKKARVVPILNEEIDRYLETIDWLA